MARVIGRFAPTANVMSKEKINSVIFQTRTEKMLKYIFYMLGHSPDVLLAEINK